LFFLLDQKEQKSQEKTKLPSAKLNARLAVFSGQPACPVGRRFFDSFLKRMTFELMKQDKFLE
jgi:hypothetical protein